jgi:transcriptional regulator with XRE-family HTH domain
MPKKPHPLALELADKRKQAKIGLEDVAEKSGYSISYLMKLECGDRQPGFGVINAWAETLGYDVVLKRKD